MAGLKKVRSLLIISIFISLIFSLSVNASVGPVSGITATGSSGSDPIDLNSITVGGYTVTVDDLYTGTSSGSGGGSLPITNADNFNLYDVTTSYNPLDTVYFGGELWTDTNGDNPDFFIFESRGNDSGTLQAILEDGSLGNTISFSSGDWGDTGYDDSYGRSHGLAFSVTDLKDSTGNNLTNSSVLQGIRISSSGIDPGCICAVVVESANEPPVITSSPVTEAYVDQLYYYDVEATGTPAPQFFLQISPTGMTIDSSTGVIEWTPSAVDDVNVMVVAANGEEPNSTQTFTISVSEPPPAGIVPITSITADGTSGSGSIMLQSITVDGYTIGVDGLYTGTGTGSGGSSSYPVENADNFNIDNFASQLNPHDIINFGGDLFSDENGSNPDFFIFENGGNDSGTIQAIFPDDSLGNEVSFSSSDFGDTSYDSSVGGQDIKAVAFEIRDLLDASGENLTNSSVIKGIRINSGGLDPSCICAVTIPANLEAPDINSTPVTSAVAGETYVYDVDANGLPEPTFSLLTAPPNMDINSVTGLIQWTPDSTQLGLKEVQVQATNSEGTDTQTFDIDVAGVVPSITSSPVLNAYINEVYIYDVDANGIPDPNFALLNSPTGMTIDDSNGMIQWIPEYDHLGLNAVEIKAYNTEGFDIQVFDVNVTETPLCPIEMIHSWKLDEQGGPLYADSYGTADANSVSSPTAVTGFVNGAQDFNGVSDYLFTENTSNPVNEITIMAWIYPYDLSQSGPDESIISKENVFELSIEESNERISWVILDGQGTSAGHYDEYEPAVAENSISEQVWTHIAVTFDGVSQAIYINGAKIGEDPADFTSLGDVQNPYVIGWANMWESRFFNGIIDEVAVYDQALSTSKIDELYQRGLQGRGYCNILPEFTELDLISVDNKIDISGGLENGFNLQLNGESNLYQLDLGAGTATNKGIIADGEQPVYFGFTLDEPNALLASYFETKHQGMPYKDELVAIANAESPIFYVKVENIDGQEEFSLIDGFMLDTQILEPAEIPLRINGDYPESSYNYIGVIEDEFGVQNIIEVQMSTCIDADDDDICDSLECMKTNINGVGRIDFADFEILADNWLSNLPGSDGDIDEDGEVEFFDLDQISQHWLSECN